MNKLIKLLLISAVVVSASPAFAYDNPSYDSWTNMSDKTVKQGNPVRVLKLVRFGATEQGTQGISAGEAVVYDTNSDDGVTIRRTTTSADAAIAGIAATSIPSADAGATEAQSDAGRDNWGWIVVHGPASANHIVGGLNAASVGTPFYTSRDGGMVSGLQTGAGAPQSDVLRMATATGGFFYDAEGSDTTNPQIDVFVMLE